MKQPFLSIIYLGAGAQIHMRSWIEIGGVRPFTFLNIRVLFF